MKMNVKNFFFFEITRYLIFVLFLEDYDRQSFILTASYVPLERSKKQQIKKF